MPTNKRLLDIALSFLGMTILMPLLCFIILAIKIDSSGPTIFAQKRYGRRRIIFKLIKFRTLKDDEHASQKQKRYIEVDKKNYRVTKIGIILRKSGIDELPQLINVLRGEMSLIGPRPHPVTMDNELSGMIPHYFDRLNVNPGITGWAQVNGRRGPAREPRIMRQRLVYDLWYIKHYSFWLDIRIIRMTIKEALMGLWRMVSDRIKIMIK